VASLNSIGVYKFQNVIKNCSVGGFTLEPIATGNFFLDMYTYAILLCTF